MADNNKTYQIVKGIQQAAMNARDYPEGYNANEEGLDFLRRSEGDKVLDSRAMDGFDARINGNILTISYQSEVTMQEAHESDFENNIRRTLNEIKTYLQKEYRNIMDESISLERMDDDPQIELRYASRVRVWVEATQHYEIPSIDPVEDEEATEKQQNADELDVLLRECRQKAGLDS